jgi:hypothetical protein
MQVGLGTIDGGFAKTNADMVTWHRGMAVLQRRIADETPVGSVQARSRNTNQELH